MALREWVQGAGRIVTRALLHPRWRDLPPVSWTYLQLYLFGKRLTESREVALLRSLIRPGMVIADVGANTGFYTIEMAACVGPQGRVLAFEPDPFIFNLLQARVRNTRWSNAEVHQLALGDANGRATLYSSAYNRADNRLAASHVEPHVETTEVQVRRLDEFLASHGSPSIDALKIDVQGSEAQVLSGAGKTLSGVQWIWVEFSPDHLRGAGTDPDRFLESLAGTGMDLFEVTEHGSLEPIEDYHGHTEKIGASYGDLVAMAKGVARRRGEAAARKHT
jgi:FkbM family methyltransferase